MVAAIGINGSFVFGAVFRPVIAETEPGEFVNVVEV